MQNITGKLSIKEKEGRSDMSDYTGILSKFAAELKYEDIPADVVETAKKITLHTMGAALASMPIEQAQNAIRYAQKKCGVGESTIWGSDGTKVPATSAAFANGTTADILDWEDCSWTGHPSCGAIPDAFAMCEKLGCSGKKYLETVVTAFEVYQRIAISAFPSDEWRTNKGWGIVSWQIMAGAIAAAKAMELNPSQIAQTMGMAYYMTLACVRKHGKPGAKSDVYHYAHGFVARNGINAAEIAEIGYGNLYDALDGGNGYWSIISDSIDWSWLDRELGKTWLIKECMEKHWPTNMWVQVPLSILDYLVKTYHFTADDVVKIETTPNVTLLMDSYESSTRDVLDAQFSIPYCLTAYLLDNTPGAHWFSPERRFDPEITKHTVKFSAYGDPTPTGKLFSVFRTGTYPEFTVKVTLKDGRELSHSMKYAKGHPRNPYTLAEECNQFRLMVGPILPEEQIEGIIENVLNLENLSNISNLADLTTIKK